MAIFAEFPSFHIIIHLVVALLINNVASYLVAHIFMVP